MSEQKWYLGTIKGTKQRVYLYDFEWECEWYWAGGYIGNKSFHAHFDGCFLDVPDSRGHPLGNFFDPWTKPTDYLKEEDIVRLDNGAAVWSDLGTFLDNPQYNPKQWWRIKDLFKQFYALKKAAEVFQYGGHCTSNGRTEAELDKDMAAKINKHIETVIIPLIRQVLNEPMGIARAIEKTFK